MESSDIVIRYPVLAFVDELQHGAAGGNRDVVAMRLNGPELCLDAAFRLPPFPMSAEPGTMCCRARLRTHEV